MAGRNYWPTSGWRTASPDTQQLDASLLLTLDDIIRTDYPHMHSLLVIRHGYLVFEGYYSGYDSDRKHEIRSINKSFVSALVGIALKEGYLTGLDQKIGDLLPEYFGPDIDARKRTITLRHLLTMTAGLECDDDDSNFWLIRSHHDWAKATLGLPLIHEPGKQFKYDSAAMHLLSVILTKQTGLNAFQFAQPRLFEPLGIEVADWPADPQQHSEGAAGLALTPREMAKFGYLYLNGGTWNDKIIVPEWFVKESILKHSEGGNPEPAAYGYLWWVMPEVQPFIYCAAGYGGQYIFVIPDQDLIVVTTGDYTLFPPPQVPIPRFFKHIIPVTWRTKSR